MPVGKQDYRRGKTLLYLGKENEDNPHDAGVALLLTKETTKSLMEWEPVSNRIISARFEYRYQKTYIIMCYAPTNRTEEEEKDYLYSQLQAAVDKAPKHYMPIFIVGT
uniref:Uncharacterized protein n=1 Tax=Arion vulgaris TaxID=1028688 RepID=A0A0B7AZX4_9EUPU